MPSSTPQTPRQSSPEEDRRSHLRRKIDQLTYASFGAGNGGILLNLGEEGASFQGIGAVRTGQLVDLTFKLPGTESQVEVRAEVVWSNESGKGGGLRFIALSEAARQQIREWLASGESTTNFAEEPAPDTEPVSSLIASYENLMQSSPAPISSPTPTPSPAPTPSSSRAQTPISSPVPISSPAPISAPASISSPTPAAYVQPETMPGSLDPPASNIRPNFQLAPDDSPASPVGVGRAGTPSFILAEYPEPRPERSASPKYVLFATGVLAGCIGVLAAIVGMRMLSNPARTANPESSQSSAAVPVAGEASQNSPVKDAATNDTQMTSSSQSVDPSAAATGRSMNESAPEDVAAIEPPTPPEVAAKPLRDSPQKRNSNDRRNLSMVRPRMPAPRSRIENREPSVAEGAQPAFGSAEGPRIAVPSVPDVPKPPQPSAEKSSRAVGFTEPVLIDHNPPVYPASAMKKHIGGLVTVNATIGTDGVPRELRLVSGDPSLGQAAEEAISHWRYVPAVSGGVPVESQVAITVNFQVKP
jgi:TonB family protein